MTMSDVATIVRQDSRGTRRADGARRGSALATASWDSSSLTCARSCANSAAGSVESDDPLIASHRLPASATGSVRGGVMLRCSAAG